MTEDQVILIDKPAGITSFGVVARVRRKLSQEFGHKVKVGHTGTLDPFATGLMIIVTGKECRNAGQYSKLDKVYEATIRLGETSSTGDPEGELTPVSDKIPTVDEIKTVLASFVGDITQRPPIYSAIKINGERAYKLARKGETVEMPERTVTVFSLDLVEYAYPELRIRTHVGSGTYIRTLAEDVGRTLGAGAYCSELRRTAIASRSIDEALPLDTYMSDQTI
jgi:tRNA pseudouridine55 synthase